MVRRYMLRLGGQMLDFQHLRAMLAWYLLLVVIGIVITLVGQSFNLTLNDSVKVASGVIVLVMAAFMKPWRL